jgi:isochorismate synthase
MATPASRLADRRVAAPDSQEIDVGRLALDLGLIARAAALVPDGGLPMVAWRDPDEGSQWLGIGAAHDLIALDAEVAWGLPDRCRAIVVAGPRSDAASRVVSSPPSACPRYFGGLAFDPTAAEAAGAVAGRFFLPRILLARRETGRVDVSFHTLAARWDDPGAAERRLAQARADFDRIVALAGACKASLARPAERDWQVVFENAGRDRWLSATRRILREIGHGAVEKLVLSREVVVACKGGDAWDAFEALERGATGTARVALQFAPDETFLFASPERLLTLEGRRIAVDALAGTVRQTGKPDADLRLMAQLAGDAKSRGEFDVVRDGIQAALGPLCEDFAWGGEAVRRVPGLFHLHDTAMGTLPPDVSLGHALRRLHPTPAVGAWPRSEGLALLRVLEGRNRGWYAAPIGWIGPDGAEFRVAIRCATVRGGRAVLTVGAGIVSGSTPEGEWDETEAKAQAMLALLRGRP